MPEGSWQDPRDPIMSNAIQSPATSPAAAAPATRPRLGSLDALRGFDMFWIVGGEGLVHGLRKLSDAGPVRALAYQMDHRPWAGFAFYDLIFPMFVFIVGVSLVFSLTRLIENEGRAAAVGRIVKRAALMYAIGILYYGGFGTPFEKIRLLGVLQRIALCYLGAGLAFVWLKPRGLAMLSAALLVGYWAMMTFIPVPGFGPRDFAEGHNLANWIDARYLPLRKWDGDHDPEGLLSTLPAIAGCILGVFAGLLMQRSDLPDTRKAKTLVLAGVACLAAGWLWHLQFPVVKKIWTSSFVLVATGNACLLLAAFHYTIECRGWRRWAEPFVWIGLNPIAIYLAQPLLDLEGLAKRFVGGDLGKLVFGRAEELITAIVVCAFAFLICRWLHQRKIYLRL